MRQSALSFKSSVLIGSKLKQKAEADESDATQVDRMERLQGTLKSPSKTLGREK